MAKQQTVKQREKGNLKKEPTKQCDATEKVLMRLNKFNLKICVKKDNFNWINCQHIYNLKIMNQFTLRLKKVALSLSKWQSSVTPKVELWVDKYKIVKVGCVFGIGNILDIKSSIATSSMMGFWLQWYSEECKMKLPTKKKSFIEGFRANAN